MNLFIAGICGTFMAGIAQLAREQGHRVRGCDANVYPPMSDVLAEAGISVLPGYDPSHIDPDTDQIIIGNALSRGNPLVEWMLEEGIPLLSGPAWLAGHVLPPYRVIAVAGTHGKTSTSSMITWILEQAGRKPGYLIGGKPGNFSETARLGEGEEFVIEADEYDTAFFDKRSKFVHYLPRIAVLNNLEFDHADIFDDLTQIKRQFHHLIRTIPRSGSIIVNGDDANLLEVLTSGCWSRTVGFSLEDPETGWHATPKTASAESFDISRCGSQIGTVDWKCFGTHNMQNALAAIVAATEVGVEPEIACKALEKYRPNARRLQCLYRSSETILFEDFAHHPTAIARTLEAVRAQFPGYRLIAILEPRSNTMRLGHSPGLLGNALAQADRTILYQSGAIAWNPDSIPGSDKISVQTEIGNVAMRALDFMEGKTVLVAMSNGGFDGLPSKLATALEEWESRPK